MNIGLDLDGVLYPWHTSLYRYFNEFKGYEGDERQFWKYIQELPADVADYYVSIPTLYLDTTPTEDVLTYVPKLAEVATLYYVTSRPPELEWATRKFFKIYDLPFSENIVFSHDKANFCRLLKLEYFLDDLPKNVDAIKGVTNAFLFKAVHNWEVRDNYPLINSMKEFYELIKSKVG